LRHFEFPENSFNPFLEDYLPGRWHFSSLSDLLLNPDSGYSNKSGAEEATRKIGASNSSKAKKATPTTGKLGVETNQT
jgi:hypothetical protein